ncbi:LysR family transcriptional regulator [Gelidibacter salicanalis]|uniref:LysR family transcriptional regulator n=1 Tax=Gelidibacter salicanalis TaxID=291193 RepID=A0A934NJG6_9FLAO|nr:LysR family transcriptional regulator [Gelidibacter salicanalis]MBJ7882538.1 LysR family transcriptional regulator [Gelidibacter salicanalis]
MFDYKLHIFLTVATRSSFSKAAEDLYITQPAITRHIQQLETHFNQKLFERKGNSINLTYAGSILLGHCKALEQMHRTLQFDMNALIDKTEGTLRIAASTTIAQYILPEVLAKFHKKYPKINVSLFSANTERVEKDILDGNADIGFIEGTVKNRELAYRVFLEDEIVLVVAQGHSLFNSQAIHVNAIKNLPLVLREKGSGSLEVIMNSLKNVSISEVHLKIEMHLGSSESIKSYLKDKESVAFLSINTILDELKSGTLGIVDINDFSINRQFSYIQQQGHQATLSHLFLNFIHFHYNLS